MRSVKLNLSLVPWSKGSWKWGGIICSVGNYDAPTHFPITGLHEEVGGAKANQ